MKARVLVFLAIGSLAAVAAPVKSPELLKASCEFLKSEYPEESFDRGFDQWGIEILSDRDCSILKSNVTYAKEEKIGSKKFVTHLEAEFRNDGFVCNLQALRNVTVKLDRNDKPTWIVGEWSVSGADQVTHTCRIHADPFMETFEFSKTSPNVRRMTESEFAKLKLQNQPDNTHLAPDDGTYGAYSWYYFVFNNAGKKVGIVEYMHYYNSEMESGSGFILKYNLSGTFIGYLYDEKEEDTLDFCEFLEGNLEDEGYQESYNESCK